MLSCVYCECPYTRFFVDTVRLMVYIKYSDQYIETHWDVPVFPGTMDSSSTYKYVADGVFYIVYMPLLLVLAFLSKGQQSVYTYPLRPFATSMHITSKYGYWGDMGRSLFPCFYNDDKDKDKTRSSNANVELRGPNEPTLEHDYQAYRMKQVHLLTEFLVHEVNLPHTWQAYGSGPRDLAYDVFLSVAGGTPAMEAEVVANALIDNHIDSKYVLWEMANNARNTNDTEKPDLHEVFRAEKTLETAKNNLAACSKKKKKQFQEEVDEAVKNFDHLKRVQPLFKDGAASKVFPLLKAYFQNPHHLPIRNWIEFHEYFQPVDDFLKAKKNQIGTINHCQFRQKS